MNNIVFRMYAIVLFGLVTSCLGYSLKDTPYIETDPRIIDGKTADIKEFPYQLSLQHRGPYSCAATIISNEWALTSAHCVHNYDPGRVSVRAGSVSQESGGSVHNATQVIWHPHFSLVTHDYDIALIKVSPPFEFNDTVQSVKLPDENESVASGKMAVVSGWGQISSDDNQNSPVLLFTSLPVVDHEVCNYEYSGKITPRMICAGFSATGDHACRGDSGDPLVSDGKVIGTVSWSRGCALANYPGVYTNVAAFRSWIREYSGV